MSAKNIRFVIVAGNPTAIIDRDVGGTYHTQSITDAKSLLDLANGMQDKIDSLVACISSLVKDNLAIIKANSRTEHEMQLQEIELEHWKDKVTDMQAELEKLTEKYNIATRDNFGMES